MTMHRFAAFLLLSASSEAFIAQPRSAARPRTVLNLEDHIANMIDKELDRLLHKDELERKWVEKNAKVLETHIPAGFDFDDNSMMEEIMSPVQRRKDQKMARNDPQKYCADRCLTTGNCEVYEDFFEMSPTDVVKFCSDCVLSEDEEPCDVPDVMLQDGFDKLRP